MRRKILILTYPTYTPFLKKQFLNCGYDVVITTASEQGISTIKNTEDRFKALFRQNENIDGECCYYYFLHDGDFYGRGHNSGRQDEYCSDFRYVFTFHHDEDNDIFNMIFCDDLDIERFFSFQ